MPSRGSRGGSAAALLPPLSRVLHCSVDDLRLASRFIALLSRDSGPQLGLHAPATAL